MGRGGNHGKVRIECSVDPMIADALAMLRAVDESKDEVYRHRLARYAAEAIETYIPFLFKERFNISLPEFRRRYPAPRRKQLAGIARELLRSEGDNAFYRPNSAVRGLQAKANA